MLTKEQVNNIEDAVAFLQDLLELNRVSKRLKSSEAKEQNAETIAELVRTSKELVENI